MTVSRALRSVFHRASKVVFIFHSLSPAPRSPEMKSDALPAVEGESAFSFRWLGNGRESNAQTLIGIRPAFAPHVNVPDCWPLVLGRINGKLFRVVRSVLTGLRSLVWFALLPAVSRRRSRRGRGVRA